MAATNMIDGSGLSVQNDISATHVTTWSGNEWYSILDSASFPETIRFDLGSSYNDLAEFYLWNEESNGVRDFSLSFFDAGLNALGQTGSYTAILNTSTSAAGYTAQAFNFAAVDAVRYVDLNVASSHRSNGTLAIGEVGFGQVPEPSSALLMGIAALGAFARRRR